MRVRNTKPAGAWLWYFALLIGLATVARAQTPPPPATLAELQQRLTAHLTHPRFAAVTWGGKVVSLESGKTHFEQNAEKFFSPASNHKLHTMALVDGTLRNRMKATSAAGNVRAKTGTLCWANSLSGHVTTAAGERLIFCIMLNRHAAPDAVHSSRAEIDRIAFILAEFAGRSDQ